MCKSFSISKAVLLTLCLSVALCLLACSALAEDMLVQTYSAVLAGETRTVQVYRVDNSASEYDEQPYRVDVEGMPQDAEMIFMNSEPTSEISLLRFVDINFDGNADIAALRTCGATDSFADFFVYSPQTGAFVKDEALTYISLYRAQLYPEQSIILNYEHDGAATGTWQLYRWEGDGASRSLKLLRDASMLFEGNDTDNIHDTVSEYAEDGSKTVLYGDTHSTYVDEDEYNAVMDKLLNMLWQGYNSSEASIAIDISEGELVYNARMLFYNPNGGQYYHYNQYCPSVSDKYLPLDAFDEGKLGEAPFGKLKPCPMCTNNDN